MFARVSCFVLLGFLPVWPQTRIISHVTVAGGSFTTTLTLQNNAINRQTIELTGYASNGQKLQTVSFSLDPGASMSGVASTLLNSTAVSHFTISGNAETVVSAAYRIGTGRGSPAHLVEQNSQSHVWQLLAGDWSEVFDGVAIVNTDLDSAYVEVVQVDSSGHDIGFAVVNSALAPNAKALYVIGGPAGTVFNSDPTSHFEIRSNQNIAITALRGTVAGAPVGLLWANQATPLAEPVLYAAANFPIGMAVQTSRIQDGDPFQTGLVRHFNSVTCENEMKPGLIHPQANTYDWTSADTTVAFAQSHGMSVHGHVLVWHEQIPSWMSNFAGSTAEWEAMLRSHIQTVVGHYKGKVTSWDVVNEAFLDDGSPRSTIWQQNISDYMAKAFTWAHEADPAATLFYNDYNMEGLPAKRVAVLAAIADLKARGIPIDGIGFQAHVNLDWPTSADFKAAVSAAAAMNLLIRFSELDVSVNPNNTQSQLTDSLRIQQRARYKEIAEAYLTAPDTLRHGITLWGLRDPDSWILYVFNRQDWPCLFDDAYRAKPAFYGFWEGLMP